MDSLVGGVFGGVFTDTNILRAILINLHVIKTRILLVELDKQVLKSLQMHEHKHQEHLVLLKNVLNQ